jgi:hypothetical protein
VKKAVWPVPIMGRAAYLFGHPVNPTKEAVVEFIQIIECRTKRIEEIEQLEKEWRAATEGKRTLRRSFVTRDRNDPDRYLVLAFFDDYDSAMENSNLPETAEFGAKQAALCDAPLGFTDLDVLTAIEG